MRYERDQENSRRGQSSDKRRPERYHQFGAEEDRSMRDSARDYGRFRNEDNYNLDADYFHEHDDGGDSHSNLGGDLNFGGRSGRARNREYGGARYDRDAYPSQNRNSYRFESDYSMDRRDQGEAHPGYRSYSGGRSHGHHFGDFAGSHQGSNQSASHTELEHPSMWESMKDFFGVGPKGYSRSDDRIREDVSDALTRDRFVDASEIEVLVMGGIVTLRGGVTDKWMKRRTEDCAEEITGVKEVRNELELHRENRAIRMDYISSGSRTGSPGSTGNLSAGSLPGANTGGGSKAADRGSEKSSGKKSAS